MTATPLLQVENLHRQYTMPREKLFGPPPKVHALNGVSFTISWKASAKATRPTAV